MSKIRLTDLCDGRGIRPDEYVRKLVGDDGYRLRVGNNRIIVDLDKKRLAILVLRIGHRKNV